jgi:hypothetical protein
MSHVQRKAARLAAVGQVRAGGAGPRIEALEGRRLLSASTADLAVPAAVDPNATVDVAAADTTVTIRGGDSVLGGTTRGRLTTSVVNTGTDRINASGTVLFYASPDATFDETDTLLDTISTRIRLAAGQARTFTSNITFPAVPDGNYTILARVALEDSTAESTIDNNVSAAPAPVLIAAPFVDLAAQALTLNFRGTSAIGEDTTGTATTQVVNAGNVAYRGPMALNLYASLDGTIDAGDALVATVGRNVNLREGRPLTLRQQFTFPNVPDGVYTFLARVEPLSGEVAQENDVAIGQTVAIAAPFVDLSGTFRSTPNNARAGRNAASTLTLTNSGNQEVRREPVTVTYFLSTDPTLDAGDTQVLSVIRNLSLRAGGSTTLPARIPVAAETLPGTYFLIASINSDAAITESTLDNNVAFSVTPITIA